MGKLIFFDIDGTLKMPGLDPRPAVVRAIRAARANGHKVFLSTGRLERHVPDSIRDIGFDGGIYSAGGRAVVGGETILDLPMSGELFRRITEALEKRDIFPVLETVTGAYSGQSWQRYPHFTREGYASLKSRLRLLESEERSGDDPVYKIVFFAPPGTDLRALAEELAPVAKVVAFSYLADIDSLPSGEITHRETHKGRALLHICRHLGAGPEDCVAFGDSMNDAEILRAAGWGVAVGNADDELKQVADEVCGSFLEDGIAHALDKLGLTGPSR